MFLREPVPHSIHSVFPEKMFLLSSAVHPSSRQMLQVAPSLETIVRDSPIDGSACTGKMNQSSVSGHIQQTGSVHLVRPEGPTDATLYLSWLSLSPPPYTCIHTHRLEHAYTHTGMLGPSQSLIASDLSSSVASSAPLGPQLL